MKKGLWINILLLFGLTLAGCFALAEPEAASGTAVAPTIAASTPAAAEPTEKPPEEPTVAETAVPEPAEDETVPAEDTAVPETQSDGATIYEIAPSRSEARFTVQEVLRGADTTVVGVSSNLAGQIAFDLSDPTTAQVGEILINARDFATDSSFRNRAIANEILLTNDYEFITFTPKELVGLPDSVTVGETYDFQIVGDLTIIGQTQEVTFDATVTPKSETELEGLASTTIQYAEFGVTVPLSQAVTAVAENVVLELDFVAVAQ